MSAVVMEPSPETRKNESPKKLLTGEEFAVEYADTPCVELVRGRVVNVTPPGFEHGWVELNIGGVLREFVRRNKLGRVATGDAGLYTRQLPDSVRGADVLFISNERLKKRSEKAFLDVAPELAVEVLSPNDRWKEIQDKVQEYLDAGVLMVWVADPEDKAITVFRKNAMYVFKESDSITGEDVLPGFSCPVREFFEE